MWPSISIPQRSLLRNGVIALLYGEPLKGFRYKVSAGEMFSDVLYEGHLVAGTGAVRVDLSSLFIQKQAGSADYKIELTLDDNSQAIAETFTVYGGGISKIIQRKLSASGTDIFVEKLKNSTRNFFLTSRSNSRLIVIPEDELMPLSFYANGLSFLIKSGSTIVATHNYENDTTESLKQIDLTELRQSLILSHGRFASLFDITTPGNDTVCTILISLSQANKKYFLKFLNSWGVYEKIAIDGRIDFNPTFSEPEIVAKYDNVINAFVDVPERKTVTHTYKAEMGYKTPDERLYLIDAMLSNDCYLIANGHEYAVKTKCESTLFQSLSNEPTTISVTLELLDKDFNYTDLSEYDELTDSADDIEIILSGNDAGNSTGDSTSSSAKVDQSTFDAFVAKVTADIKYTIDLIGDSNIDFAQEFISGLE